MSATKFIPREMSKSDSARVGASGRERQMSAISARVGLAWMFARAHGARSLGVAHSEIPSLHTPVLGAWVGLLEAFRVVEWLRVSIPSAE